MKQTKHPHRALKILCTAVVTVAVIGTSAAVLYKGLAHGEAQVQAAYRQIREHLEVRTTLAGRLASEVDAQTGTYGELTAAVRQACLLLRDATDTQALIDADAVCSGAVTQLLAATQEDALLTASPTLGELAQALQQNESTVIAARKSYNDMAMSYNRKLRALPARWVAQAAGMEQYSAFTATPQWCEPTSSPVSTG